VLGLRLDHGSEWHLLQVPELRQHQRVQLDTARKEEANAVSSSSVGQAVVAHRRWAEAPQCPCGGLTHWDGRKFRCRGCGLYHETCCDGGRCG